MKEERWPRPVENAATRTAKVILSSVSSLRGSRATVDHEPFALTGAG
jgi:hypothetical protein